jgi:hypothetical protein
LDIETSSIPNFAFVSLIRSSFKFFFGEVRTGGPANPSISTNPNVSKGVGELVGRFVVGLGVFLMFGRLFFDFFDSDLFDFDFLNFLLF